jgi:S1-C subfamily serine protease
MRISTSAEYRDSLKEFTPGDQIPIRVYRGSEELSFDVISQEMPTSRMMELSWDLLGIQAGQLTSNAATQYEILVNKGVLVTNIRLDSPADLVGMKKGDVILQFDRIEVKDEKDLLRGIQNAIYRDSVTLVVLRRSNAYRVTLEFE